MAPVEDRILQILNKIANEQNYKGYKIQVNPISSDGANYSSFLYVATVSSDSKDNLNLFIKAAVQTLYNRETITSQFYSIETFMYSNIKKAFRAIEDKNNVHVKDRLHFAEYYGGTVTPKEEMLVLENLTPKGFRIHDRCKSMDWEYASSAVTTLAKYHALSLAYQQENPGEFKYCTEKLMVKLFDKDMFLYVWLPGIKLALNAICEEKQTKLRKFCETVNFEMFTQYLECPRLKVIRHGDFRPSNLLHKNLDDGTVQLILVDFQTLHLGSPVIDLLYLIFTGTDQQFRTQHYQRLIDHYYTQFDAALRRLGMDTTNIYPRADFDADIIESLPYGLIVAMFSLPFLTVDAEDAPAIGSLVVKNVSRVYVERLNGLIDDYVKWGVIKD